MRRIILFAVFVWVGFSTHIQTPLYVQGRQIDDSISPFAAPTPERPKCVPCVKGDGKTNAAPNITNLAIDKTEIRPPCSGDDTEVRRASTVAVTTTAEDPDGDVLTYNYTISGGRIVGTGKNVYWNLANVRPGTYSITAGVDDGCGICGKTETKLITVAECTSAE